MNISHPSIRTTLKSLTSIIGLNVLLFLGFFLPGLGIWAKRIFFILCTRNELDRIRTYSNIPLSTLNTRLLKIKKTVVLTNVCEWSRAYSYRIDVEELRHKGFDTTKLTTPGCHLTARELELLSEALMMAAPPKLNYGQHAMYTDIQRILCDRSYTCELS